MGMKKTGTLFLAFGLFLLSVQLTRAQTPSFLAPNATIDHGTTTTFSAEIKTVNFNLLTGLQFTISWDSTVLRFTGLDDFALDFNEEANFGTTKTSSGILTFLWYDPTVMGVSLADSTVLFSIQFEIIGDVNTSSAIRFGDTPTKREVVDANADVISANYEDGMLMIIGTTGTGFTSNPDQVKVNGVFPNPFTSSTRIEFELEKATMTYLKIFDAQGKMIHFEQRYFDSGNHSLNLGPQHFPGKGTYIYQMSSPEFVVTQKLICL